MMDPLNNTSNPLADVPSRPHRASEMAARWRRRRMLSCKADRRLPGHSALAPLHPARQQLLPHGPRLSAPPHHPRSAKAQQAARRASGPPQQPWRRAPGRGSGSRQVGRHVRGSLGLLARPARRPDPPRTALPQDLSTLDASKLTPLSPEVISRQATINIGAPGLPWGLSSGHPSMVGLGAVQGTRCMQQPACWEQRRHERRRRASERRQRESASPQAHTCCC